MWQDNKFYRSQIVMGMMYYYKLTWYDILFTYTFCNSNRHPRRTQPSAETDTDAIVQLEKERTGYASFAKGKVIDVLRYS